MTANEYLEQRLYSGMHKGQMHSCLRDVGRLAGGYAASGAITGREISDLGGLAVSLSIQKKDGAEKWAEAVSFGRGQPVEFAEKRESKPLDWGDEIGRNILDDDFKVVDHDWLEIVEIEAPTDWNPKEELTRYLQVLFQADEHVAYVNEATIKGDKWVPRNKGVFDRTAGQLIAELNRYSTVEEVFGDPKPIEAGAWIRFNPFDGAGCKDDNVTSLRHVLVESDDIAIDLQNSLIRKLELPVTALVNSGGKSVHAIIKIDADTIEEYRKRVNFLYEVCDKNGLSIDPANRNPSRLSRMPGIMRGEKRQWLIDTNIGKGSWNEWEKYISELNDDLPDIQVSTELTKAPPKKADELIEGVLREGHKMRLAGPSKAGKSFALIQLAIAIAEGKNWLGWKCKKGRVLYINLELDEASIYHRLADVYAAKGWPLNHTDNLHVWNLRGRSMPMDKLAPRLIRRAINAKYTAIIIDPIYKVLTGDENSAEDMSVFCNQFDKLCNELKCAVIDCHHHSKGSQGSKSSRDRASGSGVFARDPDALLDLVELNASAAKGVKGNNLKIAAMATYLDAVKPDWRDVVPIDDQLVAQKIRAGIVIKLNRDQEQNLLKCMTDTDKQVAQITAWRVEGTLREFASFKAKNLWFEYPQHVVDEAGLLAECKIDGEEPPWKAERKASGTDEKVSKQTKFVNAVTALTDGAAPTLEEVAEYLDVSLRTVSTRIKQGGYIQEKGRIVKDEKEVNANAKR